MKKAATTALSFDSALSHEPADKRIEILRLVGDSGSISQAARQARVSYKAAWQAIDTLTNLAGVVLVERAVGGAGGGGAKITEAGRQLLAVAGRLAESREQVLAQALAGTPSPSLAAPALSHIGVRTSMRNQLPCQVEQLDVKGQMVRVHLRLGGGALLVSRITKASAELLGLQRGQAVLALCKATAVEVTALGACRAWDVESENWPQRGQFLPDLQAHSPAMGQKAGEKWTAAANLQPTLPKSDRLLAPENAGSSAPSNPGTSSASHALSGRVVRISRGATGDEVSLQLDAGLQLVGFAAPRSGLKSKAPVNARIDESAVVIALAA